MSDISNTFIHADSRGNLKPILSDTEGALTESRDRSWYETSVPCRTACPAGTDVPGYLQAVREGDYESAYRINLRDNVFPAVLGRICTRPCEPACRHGRAGLGESVAICFAKRSAADFKANHVPVTTAPLFRDTGKRVAVVGAGAAGLTAARELRRFGHQVCIFEKHDKPGGMMVLGIPAFRLPRDIVSVEIEQILSMGIELMCGVNIGDDVTLSELCADYDAVVVAVGAHQPRRPHLPGNDLQGVRHGFEFLQDVNDERRLDLGASVTVIGGGFTAVDCAQAAQYLGAKRVELVYRGARDNMRCSERELARMQEEGIDLTLHTAPTGFFGEHRIREIEWQAADRNGGRRRQETDTVLLATGQRASFLSMDDVLGRTLERIWLNGGPRTHRLEGSNLFGCGDARWGAQTIIDAIGDGKRCARTIDGFLVGEDRFQEAIRLKTVSSTGRKRAFNDIPRQHQRSLDADERGLKMEIDGGLSVEAAKQEARRCYMCNQKVEIDTRACVSCGLCLMVMPVDNCIVQLKRTGDENGKSTYAAVHDFESYDALAVDQDRCIRCNACRESCPVDCISLQEATPTLQLKVASRNAPMRSAHTAANDNEENTL